MRLEIHFRAHPGQYTAAAYRGKGYLRLSQESSEIVSILYHTFQANDSIRHGSRRFFCGFHADGFPEKQVGD